MKCLMTLQQGIVLHILLSQLSYILGDCPQRKLLTDEVGEISMSHQDYPINSYCQWLIQSDGSKYINIHFDKFLTECDYDYLYVYEGNSFSSVLIGSYGGGTIPDSISVKSSAVLIHFYSDLNYKPSIGNFRLLYSMTDCKFDCPICSSGRCLCSSNQYTGLDCMTEQCVSDSDCSDHGECVRDVFDGNLYCSCHENYIGRKCDVLVNSTLDGAGDWRELAPSDVGFESRTGHSAVYDEGTHCIWVFGGFSLTTVTNQLRKFNLITNRWELEVAGTADWPGVTYNHKAVAVDGCMYVSGGRNSTHLLSHFWRYCFGPRTWSRLSDLPEALAHHTMTLVDRLLYIVGGLTSQQTLSNSILKFDTDNPGGQWEEVVVRGGNRLDVNAAGHSTIYHADTRSLFVFGGHKEQITRFSQLTSDIYTFHVDKQHWSRLSYSASLASAPPAMAFHTAHIMGGYMVVYGGQLKRVGTESCISKQLYAYHLVCNRWVSLSDMYDALQLTDSGPIDDKGRHSHASLVINENILVIIGGYRGNVLGDIHSYKVLPSIARNSADADLGTDYCDNYVIAEGCVTDPECIWCPSPPISGCASRTKVNLCTDPIQYDCPGLCAALTDCQSCVVQSHNVTSPTYPLLRHPEPCAWCIHERTCQPLSSMTGSCQQPAAEPVGWWMGGVTEAHNQSACVSIDNWPAGFRYAVYRTPVDYSLADKVSHNDAVLVTWDKLSPGSSPTRNEANFYIHPNDVNEGGDPVELELWSQYADTNATLIEGNQEILIGELRPSGVSAERLSLRRPSTPADVFSSYSRGEKYLLQISSVNTQALLSSVATFGLQWNATTQSVSSFVDITKEYLQPYSGSNCSFYRSCLSCQVDVGCGWCPTNQQCVSRSDGSRTSAQCGTDSPQHWLVTEPTLCEVCENYIDCQHCTSTGICEWNHSSLECSRRGVEVNVTERAVDSSECHSVCNQRQNCSECLRYADECVWCDSTQSCDQFSPYLVINSYGQCTSWRDGYLTAGECLDCGSQTTCSECLAQPSCGWCGNDFNPNIGICTSGDYSTSSNCSALLSATLNVTWELLSLNLSTSALNSSNLNDLSVPASFSYGVCPDVQECALGIDLCHENATCINTPESYDCVCNQGFEGDGIEFCNKTCFYECVHGTCSGPPLYECECDLGWTNISCDTDCGCHNHSTCDISGVGTCDSCQEMTYGQHCEFCLPTSYGNATVAPGCLPCDCNGHGVSARDLCEIASGVCFCEEGFTGDHCEQCGIDSTGDPRDGQPCYSFSHTRLVVLNVTGVDGVTSQGKYEDVMYTRWIISPFSDLDASYTPTDSPVMTFTLDSISMTCPEGYVYVYDGINTNNSLGYVAAFCGSVSEDSSLRSVDIFSGYLTLVYYGNGTDNEMFTARYTVHACNNSCYGNRRCDANGSCVCKEGFTGVDCGIEICPNNCSGRGFCNQGSLTCFCDEGYSGDDCSLSSLLTVNRLVEGAHADLSPTPRQSFTVVYCSAEGFILFGGYSTQYGYMNDIWRFRSGVWSQITPSSQSPPGRYLHASVCVNGEMVIHGGLILSGNQPITDHTVWAFSFSANSWNKEAVHTADLAGHTMTHVGGSISVVIGGFSLTTDWSNNTFIYDHGTKEWMVDTEATGAVPAGLMMHSSVYHLHSNSLYIHGGYRYYIDKQLPTNETFFFSFHDHRWYKRSDDSISSTDSRYLHSAVQIGDQMVVMGGLSSQSNHLYQPSISLYDYACDCWHNVGDLPRPMSGHAAVATGSRVYIFSSNYDSLSVDTFQLPQDVCSLYSGNTSEVCTAHRGCHACEDDGFFHCFRNISSPPFPCNGTDINSTSLIVPSNGACDSSIVTDRNCKAHSNCAQCLTAWPYHGILNQKCKWCSFCNVGMCIELHQRCDIENVCVRVQSEKLVAETCIEQRCRSATCSQCVSEAQDEEGCIWTRQFMRSSEVGRQVSATPFPYWNCVTKLLINLSAIPVWSAPPATCPAPCQSFTSCSSCLNSDGGGSGSLASCYWSERLGMCLPPSALPLACEYGICAPLLESGDASLCPLPCSEYTECGDCLAHPFCGWCAEGQDDQGRGVCMEGSSTGPTSGVCGHPANQTLTIVSIESTTITYTTANDSALSNHSSWHYDSCPPENECTNGHHNCDLEKQDCTDLPIGHHCMCKDGYLLIEKDCVPQCDPECAQGTCVKPQVCECDFSWVGESCSVPCQCNKHSECVGPEATDNCTSCLNNTMGAQCELCEVLAVGNATNGGVCEDCYTVCNNHAFICMDNHTKHLLTPATNQSLVDAYLLQATHGPFNHKNVVCIDCANNTAGEKCSRCETGYFRLSEDPTMPCVPCKCQSHGFTCDEKTGANCNCQNNTKSSCHPDSDSNCHFQQCDQCESLYMGTPTGGHQCYLRLLSDDCYFLSRSPGAAGCNTPLPPLFLGQAAMYAVSPKFLNVDIKIYVNVLEGEVDIYISKSEDFFLVEWNSETQQHEVKVDPLYTLDDGRQKRDLRYRRATSNNTSNMLHLVESKVNSDMFSTYIQAETSHTELDSVYYIRGIRNRLILTLPEKGHELKTDKFYIVVVGTGSPHSRGRIIFRQDQIRIDLFVFFAVFFSCFFKFLSVCVIVWKIRSLYRQQQRRLQRAVELGQMASRPFASLLIHFDEPDLEPANQNRPSEFQVNPAACEFTDDGVAAVSTVIFEMPGGRDVPARAMFGSTLITHRVMFPNRKLPPERQKVTPT